MYTRLVTLTIRSGQTERAENVLRNEIFPVLRKQPGFVDCMGLISASNPNEYLSLTIWTDKSEAERYHREQCPQLLAKLKPCMAGPAEVREYQVGASTFHNVGLGRAA